MHPRAYNFVKAVVSELEPMPGRIVELGSYDVNGSVRELFAGAEYVGVDVRPGRGVDVVADAAEWGEDGCCDVVVTTEMLEHAESAAAIVANAYRILAPGGVFILTAAGPGRNPHGNDGGHVGKEFYRNISPDDLSAWLDEAGFSDYDIDLTGDGEDIRAVAYKPTVKAKK